MSSHRGWSTDSYRLESSACFTRFKLYVPINMQFINLFYNYNMLFIVLVNDLEMDLATVLEHDSENENWIHMTTSTNKPY